MLTKQQPVIWIADRIVLDGPAAFPVASLIILYDPAADLITGLQPVNKPVSLSLLDLVLSASNDFTAPDIIMTDLIQPCESDLFLAEQHHLTFTRGPIPTRSKGKLELLILQCRKYICGFMQDTKRDAVSLSIALESFAADFNCLTPLFLEDLPHLADPIQEAPYGTV